MPRQPGAGRGPRTLQGKGRKTGCGEEAKKRGQWYCRNGRMQRRSWRRQVSRPGPLPECVVMSMPSPAGTPDQTSKTST